MFAKKKRHKNKRQQRWQRKGKASPWDSLISIFMLALLMMCLSLLPPLATPLSCLLCSLFFAHLTCSVAVLHLN